MLKMLLIFTGIAGILVFSGCKTEKDYRNERAEKAIRYFEYSRLREMVPEKKLTLSECIAIGLKHNLDLKVRQQEEDIAAELRTAELLGMLPELNINDGFSGRSNVPASGSKAYDSCSCRELCIFLGIEGRTQNSVERNKCKSRNMESEFTKRKSYRFFIKHFIFINECNKFAATN